MQRSLIAANSRHFGERESDPRIGRMRTSVAEREPTPAGPLAAIRHVLDP
jgi:hypothetical protein